MESLQLSQVLADLSNLGAAEPQAAAAIVNANTTVRTDLSRPDIISTANSATASATTPPTAPVSSHQRRPSDLQRAWSSEGKFDKYGRRILINGPGTGSRSGSAANSIPGTLRRGDSDLEDDVDRASTLLALYDIRSKIKQQDNSSLMKAREKINALAAKQQGQSPNLKTADGLRRNRYSFPKPGL